MLGKEYRLMMISNLIIKGSKLLIILNLIIIIIIIIKMKDKLYNIEIKMQGKLWNTKT
jgi:hypothetical protein